MYTVDMYQRLRRACHVDGMSIREAAKQFGLHRNTVKKALRFSLPPGYQRSRPIKRPKLEGFTGLIDAMLADDKVRPKKQHHTAIRIHQRLRDEQGFTGGYTIVKDYVREQTLRSQEMFIPLLHPAGHAQADFGEAVVVIAGIEQKAHFLAMDLPHSDACFVKAYPAETSEAFCDGHNAAMTFFGGVPLSILYDNTKIAVARILGHGQRIRSRIFSELQSHYLFADRFGRPGKGNDKGKVEGLVGYARRNFMVPIPRFASYALFNAHLEACCRRRQADRLRGHTETIGERLQRDLAAFMPLPAVPYEACAKVGTRVSSLSLVRYRHNDYSVPVVYGHRDVLVKAYVDHVDVHCGSECIAQHERSYRKDDFIFDPLHYLALLEQKVNALDQAAPLAQWVLPDVFDTLRRLLEARMGTPGKREYVQVLRLMERFALDEVTAAVHQALQLGAIGFDAVKHLVLCRIERKPPRLNLDIYPYLPRAAVKTTAAQDYLTLLTAVAA
jgi:transposase